MTRPNHAHMYSDQGCSSVFVNWTKQVCLQTRLKWWQWWGTLDIIWNRVPDRRGSKRKWTITKCCLTVCRSIEKRHGVWAGASVAGVQWLFMQHVSDIYNTVKSNWAIFQRNLLNRHLHLQTCIISFTSVLCYKKMKIASLYRMKWCQIEMLYDKKKISHVLRKRCQKIIFVLNEFTVFNLIWSFLYWLGMPWNKYEESKLKS